MGLSSEKERRVKLLSIPDEYFLGLLWLTNGSGPEYLRVPETSDFLPPDASIVGVNYDLYSKSFQACVCSASFPETEPGMPLESIRWPMMRMVRLERQRTDDGIPVFVVDAGPAG